MSYQVLYRAYRPSNFQSVVGQDVIVKTLKNAIKLNKIAHAYLFCGPRGTGKTSVAKLFAKAINCPEFIDEACDKCPSCLASKNNNHPDIIEMDAASNNGVDEVREIIEKAQYAPVLGKYKVYIIDEVHMLSKPAFNALLKTLEEPPAHVIFILATTDPEKIIPTILSRCQRYNFSKVSSHDMTRRVVEILDNEKIDYEKEAIAALVKLADGGMRDVLSMLEQCLAYNESLSYESVKQVYGLATLQEKIEIIKTLHHGGTGELIAKVETMNRSGTDINRLCLDLIDIMKETILYASQRNTNEAKLEIISYFDAQEILEVANIDVLLSDIDELVAVITRQRQSQTPLFYLELAILKMAKTLSTTSSAPVVERVKESKEPERVVETPVIKSEVPTLVKEEPIKKEAIQEPELVQEITVVQNDIATEEIAENIFIDFEILLNILFKANRDLKIADSIIYNRIGLFEFDTEKRKFFQALNNTTLFASCEDAMIICGDPMQVATINNRIFNEDLYFFINDEFGINKVVYGIENSKCNDLATLYRDARVNPDTYNIDPEYKIKKYERKIAKEKTLEEKLYEMFGDKVKVEE